MLRGLNHITLATSDLDKSFNFYTQALGFNPHVRWKTGCYLTLGDLWLCLTQDSATPSKDYSHLALDCAPSDFNLVTANLRSAKVIEWQQNTSEGESLYILDPDGHKLEIHCGSLHSRLQSLKEKPYQGLIWF